MNKPTPEFLFVEDFKNIIKVTQNYLDYIDSGEYNDDRVLDYEYDIFETVLETIYGESVFNWITERIESSENTKTPSAKDY
jgi:hypothetical protein